MTTPNIFSVNLQTALFLTNNYEQSWIRLQTYLVDIAQKMNMRQIGFFNLLETPTGQQWFPNPVTGIQRQALRQVYEIGPIATGTTFFLPFNIANAANLTFTHIYGTVKTDAPDDRPLPYAGVVATNSIALLVSGGNIQINVGATAPNVLSGIVVLEYLKN